MTAPSEKNKRSQYQQAYVRRKTRGINEPNLFKTLRIGFGFSCENPSSFFYKNKKNLILVLLVGSHVGENFKTDFQPSFHPK